MLPRRFFIRVLLALGFLGLSGCCTKPGIPANAFGHPLPHVIAERLALAREVAWTKFHSGAPVLDPAREDALKASFVTQARAHGLAPHCAEFFITAQLDASRAVQTELLHSWENPVARPAKPPRDLASDLRPALAALTPRLIAALPHEPRPALAAATERILRDDGFSPTVISLATAPLR
jgi:chorismate mutase